jgi:hypothetical protein
VPETTFTTWFFAPSGGRKVGKTKNKNPSSQNSPERFNNNSAQQCVLQQKREQQRASSLLYVLQ